jgi:hypothetical protein
MAMMRNQKEFFKHGWYCVKQPTTAELLEGITWEQARQNECEFFQRTAPWSNVEFDLKERLGTEKLSAALGQKLFDLIVKRYLFSWYPATLALIRENADFRKFLTSCNNNSRVPWTTWVASLQISAMIQ